MSGVEVVAIVAAVVSAFHGGAELAKTYKKHRAKKRLKRQQERNYQEEQQDQREQQAQRAEAQDEVMQGMLHTSLEEGEVAVRSQFLDEQKALGRYGQLLCSGDERAKQELLMIAVSMQAEVIQSLGRAQQNLDVIVEMGQLRQLHKTTITKSYEATRSISELRQRVEVSLPISRPRLSAHSALGLSRRPSNESLARTFVTAAANLYISEPTDQRLLTVPAVSGRQQGKLRRLGPSIMTLSSYQYLIPEIRAQDIDILTLAGEPIEHENVHDTITPISTNATENLIVPVSSSSSSSNITSESEILTQPYEILGPYFLPRTLSDDAASPRTCHIPPLTITQTQSPSSNDAYLIRASSAPAIPFTTMPGRAEPDLDATSHYHTTDQRPYCPGALAAQRDFSAGFTLQNLPILPGSQKLHPSWKCNACDFNASDGDGALFSRIDFAHGVRFRFPFRARSHAPYTYPPDTFRPRYTYGCLFCTAEGRKSGVYSGSDALMAHVATKHRTNLTPEVRRRTHSVVGRLAGKDEGWDINLPDVTIRSGAGVGKWMLHAVTSLPT